MVAQPDSPLSSFRGSIETTPCQPVTAASRLSPASPASQASPSPAARINSTDQVDHSRKGDPLIVHSSSGHSKRPLFLSSLCRVKRAWILPLLLETSSTLLPSRVPDYNRYCAAFSRLRNTHIPKWSVLILLFFFLLKCDPSCKVPSKTCRWLATKSSGWAEMGKMVLPQRDWIEMDRKSMLAARQGRACSC